MVIQALRWSLIAGGDRREPAADGALIEIGGEETDGDHDLQQREVIEVQKSHSQCERGGVTAPFAG